MVRTRKRPKKKAARTKSNYLSAALFLIGLVFLTESSAVAYVITQLPASIVGTVSVAWIYVLLKFVTAIVAIAAGVYVSSKK